VATKHPHTLIGIYDTSSMPRVSSYVLNSYIDMIFSKNNGYSVIILVFFLLFNVNYIIIIRIILCKNHNFIVYCSLLPPTLVAERNKEEDTPKSFPDYPLLFFDFNITICLLHL